MCKLIVFFDGTWQTDSQYPDSDFSGGSTAYVVPDGSELANKIMSISGAVRLITDDRGQLIDAEPVVDRTAEIYTRLAAIDAEAIRPLRAIAAGTATTIDRGKIAALETEAAELRHELAEMPLEEK